MLKMVTMMLIDASTEEMPSRWMAKIRKSMDMPTWIDSGGYRVQPVLIWVPPPGKKGTTKDRISMVPAAGRIQKLRLFMTRQSHVRRADHERDHPVGQTRGGRHDRAEDHEQGVVGDQVVVEVRLQELHDRA